MNKHQRKTPSTQTSSNNTSQPPGGSTSQTKVGGSSKNTTFKEPGWKGIDSTAAFRALNFELFIKPNKFVMVVGVTAITSCLAYIGYLNLITDKTKPTYMALNEKDELEKRYKSSKWD